MSGEVSRIVIGPVAVIDTELNVFVAGSYVELPVSMIVPEGAVNEAVALDNL